MDPETTPPAAASARPEERRPSSSRWATVLAVVVLISAAVFAYSVIETSTARISASTTSAANFSSGSLELTATVQSADFLFDVNGLYPGLVVSGCLDVSYEGSWDVPLRVHGQLDSTSGLEEYVTFSLQRSPIGATCEDWDDDGNDDTASAVFAGTLDDFLTQHTSWDRGAIVEPRLASSSTIALVATAELVDDNAAQGKATNFTITVEARP